MHDEPAVRRWYRIGADSPAIRVPANVTAIRSHTIDINPLPRPFELSVRRSARGIEKDALAISTPVRMRIVAPGVRKPLKFGAIAQHPIDIRFILVGSVGWPHRESDPLSVRRPSGRRRVRTERPTVEKEMQVPTLFIGQPDRLLTRSIALEKQHATIRRDVRVAIPNRGDRTPLCHGKGD